MLMCGGIYSYRNIVNAFGGGEDARRYNSKSFYLIFVEQ